MLHLPSIPLLLPASHHQLVLFVVNQIPPKTILWRFKISENVRIPATNITMLIYSRNYEGKKS